MIVQLKCTPFFVSSFLTDEYDKERHDNGGYKKGGGMTKGSMTKLAVDVLRVTFGCQAVGTMSAHFHRHLVVYVYFNVVIAPFCHKLVFRAKLRCGILLHTGILFLINSNLARTYNNTLKTM